MTDWLMRIPRTPSVIEALLLFQLTGSPVPALIAFATTRLRRGMASYQGDAL